MQISRLTKLAIINCLKRIKIYTLEGGRGSEGKNEKEMQGEDGIQLPHILHIIISVI